MTDSLCLRDVLKNIAQLIEDPIVIVDVGAQTLSGEDHVYSPLYGLELPIRVIGFEPLADRAAARRREEQGRNIEIIEAFVGNGERIDFYENNSSGTSSLLSLNKNVCSKYMSLTGLRTCNRSNVQTSRLDDLLQFLRNCSPLFP